METNQLTDEFGNPLHIAEHSTAATTSGVAAGQQHHGSLREHLRRSGSSSSSSSEDDGKERKRKKSMKDKIKENATITTAAAVAHPHEKKGILEKIKDKLPGHH
ncbi:hypothetical protein N665_0556s0009 [Sinapis alba]|nr:hypothetical protein N665_0556s0009 [Sinapis alba]